MIVLPGGGTPARTHEYRLFVYDEKGQTVGPAKSISAGNDAEPIAQAEAIHGLLCAELLDLEGLRIVKRFPGLTGPPPKGHPK
jgi:hypothetical protein